jgi:hypothetical protein
MPSIAELLLADTNHPDATDEDFAVLQNASLFLFPDLEGTLWIVFRDHSAIRFMGDKVETGDITKWEEFLLLVIEQLSPIAVRDWLATRRQ